MAQVFDEPEQQGVVMVFDEEEVYLMNVDGVPHYAVFMEDVVAEDMLRIVQNKLNARMP